MDLQSESSGPPPCDPQPSGKINKAAFKLFGKRRSGSAVPSIFSVRNKGEGGKGLAKPPLVRSKTHDGLADTSVREGGRKEASASGEQLNTTSESSSTPSAPRASVPKSLSFFSLLRRSGRGAVGTETRPPRQRKGLRGLFSGMRWNRRDKSAGGAEPGGVLLTSRSNSVEIVKEDIALSLEPQPFVPDAVALETSEGPLAKPADWPCTAGDSGSSTITPGDAGRSRKPQEAAMDPCHSPEHSPTPCSPAHAPPPLSQESPTPSPVKATRKAPRPKHNSSPETRLLSCAPAMTVTPPEPSSEPSMDRLCSMFTDVTSLKSFDSLTGCGDIIADAEEEGASGSSSGTGSSSGGTGSGARGAGGATLSGERPSPLRAAPPAPPSSAAPAPPLVRMAAPLTVASAPAPAVLRARVMPRKPQGSGVVAYMGGGEEMASPDEVDDADMQGLWHMLPQKGQDSPALPRAESVHHAPLRAEKRPPLVKALGLSKIPVGGGGGRVGKHPREALHEDGRGKDLQDAPSNSDEGYWDSTTPGPEEESAGFLSREGLPRDSCSGDALYDLYVDPPEVGTASDEEMTPPAFSSSGGSKLTPPSQAASFRSLKGSTSLPRDSRIPISVKQTPPSHSASQGTLAPTNAATTPTSQVPVGKADAPARTKIPVSKVPVRRTSSKPISARHAPSHALNRK
ncbi:hypothetical protein AAFF_G00181660 [Aldrovandia affinis]|uniref:APC membrane recruitment protein 2 n=1 Tax=Aldrovandia affinis TaxID=143900 RepID=A0AAD7RKK7_9TELE|nr:hypothetical protein AAFF_G00181660 [Aldrovandia affinis]